MLVARSVLVVFSGSLLVARPAPAQGITRLESVDSSGNVGNNSSGTDINDGDRGLAISADGQIVVFASKATNLVAGDTNGKWDIFVHDNTTGVTERVSVDSSGAEANDDCRYPSISADGMVVAFWSLATNLVAGDTNAIYDIFVHDRATGITERVSVDSSGAQANGGTSSPAISADGRVVAFVSDATNLIAGDTNGVADVFVHDLASGITERVSVDSSGAESNDYSLYGPSISADGQVVAFDSRATNLVAGDTNGVMDVFVRDLETGTTTRVDLDPSGGQANDETGFLDFSADGLHVLFYSWSTNLVPGDTNDLPDLFVRDIAAASTMRVSLSSSGAQGDGWSYSGSLSADGRYVAFASSASDFVPEDTNFIWDAFVHDCLTGITTRVSVSSTGEQAEYVDKQIWSTSISGDGRYVVFSSGSSNLVPGDTNDAYDVFLRDRAPANTTSFCAGDGTASACPCGNSGNAFRGCQNSASSGGAVLAATGVASLGGDTLQLGSYAELPHALSLFIQGNAIIATEDFGDGLRCIGGSLKRLYTKNASGGVVSAPALGDPSVSARSATLGDPIPLGAMRVYQVYYRDPSPTFCVDPQGSTFNVSNGLQVTWGP
jgi:Tol biopolymer transport system component